MTDLVAAIDGADYSAFHVRPEFIDANGHMNVGYYSVLFDQALDEAMKPLGCDWSYTKRTNKSVFILENHVLYLREVKVGDPLAFEFLLLDHDDKRIHYFMRMKHAVEGYVAATSEQLCAHVDLATRRVAPWPDELKERFVLVQAAHAGRPRPSEIGRTVGIRRRQG